jgi:acetyl esterase/lipase
VVWFAALVLLPLASLLAADTSGKSKAAATPKAAAKAGNQDRLRNGGAHAGQRRLWHPERQVLDFYKAESFAAHAASLFHIQGGGWVAGDKAGVGQLDKFLAAGISVVSINSRYSTQAQLAGVKPPVAWAAPRRGTCPATVRSKAGEWNLDKKRIARVGRFGRGVLQPVACLPRRPRGPEKRRSRGPRVNATWCARRGVRRPRSIRSR